MTQSYLTSSWWKTRQRFLKSKEPVVIDPESCTSLLTPDLQRAAWLLALHAQDRGCGCGCCSLAPSCGAVLSNLLHLVQLRKQPLHAAFQLWQTCQGFGRLQLPGVVQPALQHCGRGQRSVHGHTHLLTLHSSSGMAGFDHSWHLHLLVEHCDHI